MHKTITCAFVANFTFWGNTGLTGRVLWIGLTILHVECCSIHKIARILVDPEKLRQFSNYNFQAEKDDLRRKVLQGALYTLQQSNTNLQ